MKNLLFLLFALCSLSLSAQANRARPAIFEQFVQTYTLTSEQMQQLERSQATWANNIADLQPLRSQQLDLYLNKLQALHANTRGTFRRLLTPEQRTQFDLAERQRKSEESARIKELSAEGQSNNQIRLALLEESL